MKKTIFMILFIATLIFNGCTSSDIEALRKENEELKQKIKAYEERINNIEYESAPEVNLLDERTNLASISYIEYEHKQRFVPKEIKLYVYPQKGALHKRIIPQNTIVQIINAGISECEDRKLWLYVNIPVYDTPMDNYGWIPEEDTEPFTKENQKLVQSDVRVKEGTEIYEVFEFEKITETKPVKVSSDTRGRLEEKKDGYVRLSCPGGLDIWVKEEYVIYPDTN